MKVFISSLLFVVACSGSVPNDPGLSGPTVSDEASISSNTNVCITKDQGSYPCNGWQWAPYGSEAIPDSLHSCSDIACPHYDPNNPNGGGVCFVPAEDGSYIWGFCQ